MDNSKFSIQSVWNYRFRIIIYTKIWIYLLPRGVIVKSSIHQFIIFTCIATASILMHHLLFSLMYGPRVLLISFILHIDRVIFSQVYWCFSYLHWEIWWSMIW
jgi:hypothetical protein